MKNLYSIYDKKLKEWQPPMAFKNTDMFKRALKESFKHNFPIFADDLELYIIGEFYESGVVNIENKDVCIHASLHPVFLGTLNSFLDLEEEKNEETV